MIYLYEFLYRGRAASEAGESTYHVALASDALDEFGNLPPPGLPMSVGEARDSGWDLPEIAAAINAETIIEIEEARRDLKAAQKRLEVAETEVARLTAELDTVKEHAPDPDRPMRIPTY